MWLLQLELLQSICTLKVGDHQMQQDAEELYSALLISLALNLKEVST